MKYRTPYEVTFAYVKDYSKETLEVLARKFHQSSQLHYLFKNRLPSLTIHLQSTCLNLALSQAYLLQDIKGTRPTPGAVLSVHTRGAHK